MFVPQSLELTVVSVYLTSQGAPNIVTSITNLPMKLLLKPCTPIKDADYKVTICTNKPAVSLIDLYPGIIVIELDYSSILSKCDLCGEKLFNSQYYIMFQSLFLKAPWQTLLVFNIFVDILSPSYLQRIPRDIGYNQTIFRLFGC